MTNEEAINALKMMNLRGAHPFLHWEEMMEVRDMAISALRQQETVAKCNEPLTNAQKIRSMSDEEMAEFISSIPMCVGKDEDLNCGIDVCKECFLKWLQQPAEEDKRENLD